MVAGSSRGFRKTPTAGRRAQRDRLLPVAAPVIARSPELVEGRRSNLSESAAGRRVVMATVRSISHINARELEEYTPIPRGWLKFLSGLFNILILMGGVLCGMYLILAKTEAWSSGDVPMISALFGGGALLIAVPIYFMTGDSGRWLRSYFARNVRGYTARFWVHEVEKSQKLYCEIWVGDLYKLTREMLPPLALGIEIRLGGWGRYCGVGLIYNGKPIGRDHILWNWRVRPHRISVHIVNVLVCLEYMRPYTDGKHEQIVLNVLDAFRLLTLVQQPGPGIENISDALRYLQGEREKLAEEVTRLEENERKLKADFEELLAEIERIEQRLDQTDRLKSTIEGRELHLMLLELLEELCRTVGDPNRALTLQARLELLRQAPKPRARRRSIRDTN